MPSRGFIEQVIDICDLGPTTIIGERSSSSCGVLDFYDACMWGIVRVLDHVKPISLSALQREPELSRRQAYRPIAHASRHCLNLDPACCLAARIAFEQVESRITCRHDLKLGLTKANEFDRERLDPEALVGLKPIGVSGMLILGADSDIGDELASLGRWP